MASLRVHVVDVTSWSRIGGVIMRPSQVAEVLEATEELVESILEMLENDPAVSSVGDLGERDDVRLVLVTTSEQPGIACSALNAVVTQVFLATATTALTDAVARA